jgi:hypothetical protein
MLLECKGWRDFFGLILVPGTLNSIRRVSSEEPLSGIDLRRLHVLDILFGL